MKPRILPLALPIACQGAIGEAAPEDSPEFVEPLPPIPAVECDGVLPVDAIPIRALTTRELNNALAVLFPQVPLPTQRIEFDGRIEAFVLNSRDAVVPEHVDAFRRVAEELSAVLVANLSMLLPCANAESRACAARYIEELAPRAFRRPLEESETARFHALYDAGAEYGHAEGMGYVFEALLQSPSFIYVHEGVGQCPPDC